MKKLIFLLGSLMIGTAAYAQNYQWHKSYRPDPLVMQSYVDGIERYQSLYMGVRADAAGNIITVGNFDRTSDFNLDSNEVYKLNASSNAAQLYSRNISTYITKATTNGSFLWAKCFQIDQTAPTGSIIEAIDFTTDNAGNMYVVGSFSGKIDIDPSATATNFVNTSTLMLNGAVQRNIFICKLDADANLVWAQTLGHVASNDMAQSVSVDNAGNVYVAGDFSADIDLNPSSAVQYAGISKGTFLLKLNSSGAFVWAKATQNISNYKTAFDNANNCYLLATFKNTLTGGSFTNSSLVAAGESNILFAKYKPNGNVVWVKAMGGGGANVAAGIIRNADNSLLLAGNFTENAPLFAIPANPSIDSSYAGFFLAKADTNSNLIWSKTVTQKIQELVYPQVSTIIADTSGIYLSCFTDDFTDLDPSDEVCHTDVTDMIDYRLIKYNLDGSLNFAWSQPLGLVSGLCVYDNNLFVTGSGYVDDDTIGILSPCIYKYGSFYSCPAKPTISKTVYCNRIVLRVVNPDPNVIYAWTRRFEPYLGTIYGDSVIGGYWSVRAITPACTSQIVEVVVKDTLEIKPPFIPLQSNVYCDSVTLSIYNAENSTNTFTWSNGMTGASIKIKESGTYSVTASNGSCTSLPTTHTITINKTPLAHFEQYGQTLVADSLPSPAEYRWYELSSGNSNYIGMGRIKTVYSSGLYRLYVNYPSSNCNGVYTKQVSGITGSKSNINAIRSLSPNPSTGQLTLETGASGTVSVYDLVGHSLWQADAVEGKNDLDLTNLSAGMYLLKLQTKDGIATQKIVIER